MEKGSTNFLKLAVILIGVIILALCIFFLPGLANDTAETFPEYSHLLYPVLIGLYLTTIPYFIALYQALRLLKMIDNDDAFSKLSVKSLKVIKYCALTISILYVIGSVFLLSQNALHPGIAVVGFMIFFASIVIAVFSGVLQKLLKNVIEIKSENDLTV